MALVVLRVAIVEMSKEGRRFFMFLTLLIAATVKVSKEVSFMTLAQLMAEYKTEAGFFYGHIFDDSSTIKSISKKEEGFSFSNTNV